MVFCKNGHGCERNFTGRYAGELGLEMGQQIILNEDHDYFGKLTNKFATEGSPIFLPNLGSIFSRTTSLVLKMIIFSYMA